ncbi:hypothetical protein, partial [Parafannyhessea umbonata]
KSEADATDEAVTETGWINDAVTATVEPNQTDKFSGYKWDSTDGETSYELAAGEATDPSTHVVKVYYVRDDSQTHSVSAQVEYYFGDTLAEAKAKSEADATDDLKIATSWLNEEVTVNLIPNETDKFVGYIWAETNGETSFTLAAGEATDPSTHVVKVYYVAEPVAPADVTPVSPQTPTPVPTDAAVPATTAGVPAPTPVIPTAAIPDDDTPTAQPEEISDDETPLAGMHVDCWVHWWIILGIIVNTIYAICVVIRRKKYTDELRRRERKVTGESDGNEVDSSSAVLQGEGE